MGLFSEQLRATKNFLQEQNINITWVNSRLGYGPVLSTITRSNKFLYVFPPFEKISTQPNQTSMLGYGPTHSMLTRNNKFLHRENVIEHIFIVKYVNEQLLHIS